MKLSRLMASVGVLGLSMLSLAQVSLNEIFRDPPSTDQGFEFVEFKGTPGQSLNGYWFLVIEADSAAAGLIDQAIPLDGQTIGANGLFMIRDDALVLNPTPDPLTNVLVLDFAPDMENGSATYAIVQNYTGYVINANTNPGQNNVLGQTDIDSNNDGIMGDWGTVTNTTGPVTTPGGSQPYSAAIDAVGFLDGTSALDWDYGNQFLASGASFFTTVGVAPGNIAFNPDATLLSSNGIALAFDLDFTGGQPPAGGPYPISPVRTEALNCTLIETSLAGETLTPGSVNPSVATAYVGTAFEIVSGIPFGGDLASLAASDDNSMFLLNDENDPNGELTVDSTYCGTSITSYAATFETSATRSDLNVFFEARRFSNSSWTLMGTAVSTLADSTNNVSVASNVGQHLGANREIKVRIRWIPQADLEAADGWAEGVDLVTWTLE